MEYLYIAFDVKALKLPFVSLILSYLFLSQKNLILLFSLSQDMI